MTFVFDQTCDDRYATAFQHYMLHVRSDRSWQVRWCIPWLSATCQIRSWQVRSRIPGLPVTCQIGSRIAITLFWDNRHLKEMGSVFKPSFLSISEASLSSLECPVCYRVLTKPILQCKEGHAVCGDCQLRIKNCPVCKDTDISNRNRVLENLLEGLWVRQFKRKT